MRQIKIKNFGPIRAGFDENEGFLDIPKVTLFIGNQGTGKSTVAKLISTFSWLEKALFREDVKENEVTRKNKFENNYCAYQGLKNYFSAETEIEFRGTAYSFYYNDGRLNVTPNDTYNEYLVPKIMYVPAERNFLSVVTQPDKLRYLPQPLYTFLDEYERSQQELTGILELPINNLKFQYHKRVANIVGSDYTIKLSEASSGLQSSVPLFLVSRNLALSINKAKDASKKEISIEEEKKLRAEIEKVLLNDKLSDELKKTALEVLSSRYKNACFINIVEEPEQNLFPKSQKDQLFKLLEFAGYAQGNELILTTHSPYIINYLTLAIKGQALLTKIAGLESESELSTRINQIVPTHSCLRAEDVKIFELNETGNIQILQGYEGVPSDNNYLNNFLAEANKLFDGLLEIEESI